MQILLFFLFLGLVLELVSAHRSERSPATTRWARQPVEFPPGWRVVIAAALYGCSHAWPWLLELGPAASWLVWGFQLLLAMYLLVALVLAMIAASANRPLFRN